MFELVDSYELDYINTRGRHRAPLVAHFKAPGLAREFLFMVNHLARKDAFARHQQARLLNRWAATQPIPVVAVGDYNFDYDVRRGDDPRHRDRGYDLLTRDEVFTWVRPGQLRQTQSSSRHRTVLDFTFVSGEAALWRARSVIVVDPEELDYGPPTDNQRSDHRPILTTFSFDERALTDQAQRHQVRRPIAEPTAVETLGHARRVETQAGGLVARLKVMLPQIGIPLNGRKAGR